MLWLALHLPHFPLQSAARAICADAPLCLHETRRGREIIVAINRKARRAGIERGMTLPAAQSLCAELTALPRNRQQESAALKQLA